ncbi:hypothetical protein A3Q56_03639 [Intoshia linei]|uniref:Uncharacterized protein n=1 Tax=Intoshia linei TaxID=1819745 RepID=A0A177B3B2_9BILA|nr:hypothetical protein A3Q56_03639 [Intoshia linei]
MDSSTYSKNEFTPTIKYPSSNTSFKRSKHSAFIQDFKANFDFNLIYQNASDHDLSLLSRHKHLIDRMLINSQNKCNVKEPLMQTQSGADVVDYHRPYSMNQRNEFRVKIQNLRKMKSNGDGFTDTVSSFKSKKRKLSTTRKISFTEKNKKKMHRQTLQFFSFPNDTRCRHIRHLIYNFLEKPKSKLEISYHILVFIMVLLCLILSVLATREEFEKHLFDALFYIEVTMLICFSIEFSLRIWSVGCRYRYRGFKGRMMYLRQPLSLIDIIVILSTCIVIFMGSSGKIFATSSLRGLRMLQIIRMIRVDRRGNTWKLLASVTWNHKQELFTSAYIGFLVLIVTSFIVYLCEKNSGNVQFDTFAGSLWWGVITMSTVGYGDAVPRTVMGKIMASFAALMGISFFALPAGIMGSGFALQVQQQQRIKHITRRRIPAVKLIQAAWRCYALTSKVKSLATWYPIYTYKESIQQSAATQQSKKYGRKSLRHFKSFHYRSAFNSKIPTRDTLEVRKISKYDNNIDNFEKILKCISREQQVIVKFIRLVKYYICLREFKEAFKPYDVKDVLDQYNVGNADLTQKIKNLQNGIFDLQYANDFMFEYMMQENMKILTKFKEMNDKITILTNTVLFPMHFNQTMIIPKTNKSRIKLNKSQSQ